STLFLVGSDEASGVGFGFQEAVATCGAEEVLIKDADDVAAGLVGVAVGVELGLDVGALGPLPELLFEFRLGFGLLEGEALLFDAKAAGDEVAAAEGDDVGEESAN